LLTQGRRSFLAPTLCSVTQRRWRSMQSLSSSIRLETMETIYSRQCLAWDKGQAIIFEYRRTTSSMQAMKTLLLLPLISLSVCDADSPTPYTPKRPTEPLMPAEQAARGMAMPDGFRCTVFASEPDVQHPIAMAWDSKGRMWVAENYTYAGTSQRFDLGLRDRVIILED